MKHLFKLLMVIVLLLNLTIMCASAPCPAPDDRPRITFNNYSEDTFIYIQSINDLLVSIAPGKKGIRVDNALIKAVAIKTVADKLLIAWMLHELRTTRSITVAQVKDDERHVLIQEFEDGAQCVYV